MRSVRLVTPIFFAVLLLILTESSYGQSGLQVISTSLEQSRQAELEAASKKDDPVIKLPKWTTMFNALTMMFVIAAGFAIPRHYNGLAEAGSKKMEALAMKDTKATYEELAKKIPELKMAESGGLRAYFNYIVDRFSATRLGKATKWVGGIIHKILAKMWALIVAPYHLTKGTIGRFPAVIVAIIAFFAGLIGLSNAHSWAKGKISEVTGGSQPTLSTPTPQEKQRRLRVARLDWEQLKAEDDDRN